MKTNFDKRIAAIMIVILTLAACKKTETEPVTTLTEDFVYDYSDKNGDYLKRIVADIYTRLPTGYNRIDGVPLDAGTDDAVASDPRSDITIFSQSRLNPTSTLDDRWSYSYTSIRSVNDFLQKEHIVPIDASVRQYYRADARFVRAITYFELLKRYGGIPLIGNKVYKLGEEINVKRNTFSECVDYIVSECNTIKDSLRKEPIALTSDYGSIPSGAALALKSRILLYAASPLNNPSNDIAKWQAAAAAAKAVIDLNKYSLDASYANAFLNRSSAEIILGYQAAKNITLENQNAPVGYMNQRVIGGGAVSPTQELVDAFPMKNGLPITDPASGYTVLTPYTNRDPRFDLSIFYNGKKWLKRSVETFEGGLDKPNDQGIKTQTGFYMRKFLGNFEASATYSSVDHNFPIFRYAEILLNYAEAANETGDVATAYLQLAALRKRAGIAAGASNLYGLTAGMDVAKMRQAIQLERRIEMAFEEQRFWDLRRWKIAEGMNGQVLHGVKIVKNETGFSYLPISVLTLTFESKNYLFPIPDEEIVNLKIAQNPGF